MGQQVLDIGTRFRTVKSNVPTGILGTAGGTNLDGTTKVFELPRTFLLKQMFLELTGQITTGGSGAFQSDQIPLEYIKKVEVIADGRKLIVSAPGRSLYMLGGHDFGVLPHLRSQQTAASQTDAEVRAVIPISFEAARMQMAADSYFDPRPYEKVECRITFGSLVTDILFTGTVQGTTPLSVNCIVEQTTKGIESARFNRLLIADDIPVTTTTTQLVQRIPRAGLLAGIQLTCLGAGSPLLQRGIDDTIINNLTVRSDNNFIHVDNVRWNNLLEMNTLQQLPFMLKTAAGAALGTDIAFPTLTGTAYVDLTEDGLLSTAINTVDLNTLDLVLNVTSGASTDHIQALYVFYEPVA